MARIYFYVKLIMAKISLQREENIVHIFACVSAKEIIRSVCTLKESNATSLFQKICNKCKYGMIFFGTRKPLTWMRGKLEKLKCRP